MVGASSVLKDSQIVFSEGCASFHSYWQCVYYSVMLYWGKCSDAATWTLFLDLLWDLCSAQCGRHHSAPARKSHLRLHMSNEKVQGIAERDTGRMEVDIWGQLWRPLYPLFYPRSLPFFLVGGSAFPVQETCTHTHFPISCVLDSICFLDKQSKAHWRCCYIPAWPCRWTSVYWVSSAVWLPGSGKKWHLDWLDLSCIVNYCVFRILHCFVYSAYDPSLFDAGLLWEEWAFEPHDQKWLEKEAKYKPKLDLRPWAQISHYKTKYPWKQ